MNYRLATFAFMIALLSAASAQAKTLCTVIADATDGKILLEQGDCRSRATPASTFKIALAVMGFDSGFLKDTHSPALPYRKEYADWGGKAWTQPTDPTRWIKYSVVWFSQQITQALGVDGLQRYARDFRYGNADFSGDPGKNNALERAWISSSLQISPLEQVAFLRNLVNGQLPASALSIEMTRQVVGSTMLPGGWQVFGKTGSAFPRKANGSFDRARGWGWFVGWATKGDTTLVFARLNQDDRKEAGSGGVRARDAFLREWQAIADGLS